MKRIGLALLGATALLLVPETGSGRSGSPGQRVRHTCPAGPFHVGEVGVVTAIIDGPSDWDALTHRGGGQYVTFTSLVLEDHRDAPTPYWHIKCWYQHPGNKESHKWFEYVPPGVLSRVVSTPGLCEKYGSNKVDCWMPTSPAPGKKLPSQHRRPRRP